MSLVWTKAQAYSWHWNIQWLPRNIKAAIDLMCSNSCLIVVHCSYIGAMLPPLTGSIADISRSTTELYQ